MPESEKDNSSSLLAKITDLLDSNVRLTRNINFQMYGIGVIGFIVAGLCVLSSALQTHLITCTSDIPAEFISRKVRVRSYVEAVGTRGIVHVQHRPFLNIIPGRWRPKSHVHLAVALVDMTPEGSKWLQDTINHRIVWFQPLSVNDSSVQANILFRKYLTKHSVNEILVGEGICKVKDLTREELKSLSFHQEELLKTLLHHQMTASEKGRGKWKIERQTDFSSRVKKFIKYPIHLWRKMRRKSSKQ
ncbi:protein C3orf33 homolog [Saccostrea cucullata]|uniref:protein C3orf33 homolog n=1 Tax=Saccostrea cuccullata TaxID=36930 RepID=UPI002ED4FF7B